MTDERIDIEVTDKVDASVETKLRGIAQAARDGYNPLIKLKQALASIDSNSVNKLADASAKMQNALARELNATARLTAAKDRAAISTQRLATETAKTALAQTRATDAAERLAQRQAKAAAAADTHARDLARLRASVDPLGRQINGVTEELRQWDAMLEKGSVDVREHAAAVTLLQGRLSALRTVQEGVNTVNTKGVAGSKAMTQATLNLSRQFADIGVTAAMGMNPLMILIQQGPQIADAFATAKTQGIGFNAVLANTQRLLAPILVPLGIVAGLVAAVGGAFLLLHRNVKGSFTDGELMRALDLNEKQLKRLKKEGVDTAITFGDTFKAVFQVLGRNAAAFVKPVTDRISSWWSTMLDDLTKNTRSEIIAIIGFFITAYDDIIDGWNSFPEVFSDLIRSAVNAGIGFLEMFVNKAIDAFNTIKNNAPAALGPLGALAALAPDASHVTLGRVDNSNAGAAGAAMTRSTDRWSEAYAGRGRGNRVGTRMVDNVGRDIRGQARTNALNRIREGAGEPGADARGRQGFNRAEELKKINDELDRQTVSMRMLSDAREVQNALDSASQVFLDNNVALNAAETAALRTKIQAIQDYKVIQSEMDRIYSEVTGPLQTYNASLAAANQLLTQGTITKDQFNQQVAKAATLYETASNPLSEINRGLNDQIALLGLYGPALERATQLQTIENTLRAQGRSLYDATTGALTAEGLALANRITLLQQGNLVQQELNTLLSDTTAQDNYLNNITALYAAIDDLRARDLISERQAMKARADAQFKYNQMRLQGTSDFFSNLASLSSSGNKKLAAIGKAAAVAQATIDGILAVQKALASSPPPWNYVMAASVGIAAAANVASILSQVSGGYKTGGYTGNASRDTIAGVVHGREYVVNASGTARHRDLLEAINAGRDPAQYMPTTSAPPANTKAIGTGGQTGDIKVSIENYGSSVITAERVGPDEVRIIAREEAQKTVQDKVPALIGAEIANPNSRARKALGAHTNTQAKR